MAKTTRPQPAHLESHLIARKGEAKPVAPEAREGEQVHEKSMPRGMKDTIAVTVRLDAERYKRLVNYGARFAPRRTNQEILVEALDTYLQYVNEE